jgi:hypothetical protein
VRHGVVGESVAVVHVVRTRSCRRVLAQVGRVQHGLPLLVVMCRWCGRLIGCCPLLGWLHVAEEGGVTDGQPFQRLDDRLAGRPIDQTLYDGVPVWLGGPLRAWVADQVDEQCPSGRPPC